MKFQNKSTYDENGCLIWGGWINDNKRPECRIQGFRSVTRLIMTILGFKLTRWDLVCHSCDNTLCINPAHLWIGSPKDNAQDCMKKGRLKPQRGELCKTSKLITEQVLEIRKLHKNREMTMFEIAEKFGVSKYTIANVVYRRAWKHV